MAIVRGPLEIAARLLKRQPLPSVNVNPEATQRVDAEIRRLQGELGLTDTDIEEIAREEGWI